MYEFIKIIKGLPILYCVALFGCSEEGIEKSELVASKKKPQVEASVAKPVEQINASLIGVSDGKLEIKVSLDGAGSNHSKLIRFAKIIDKQPVEILHSHVYIHSAINNQVKLSINMQLTYQPFYKPNDAKGMTIVSSQFTDQGAGFRWYGKITGCKNSDCSVVIENRKPEAGQITDAYNVYKRQMHEITIIWDEDNFQYLFIFDDIQTSIDMQPFETESHFDPRNFRYARLTAEVSNVDDETESGTISVRFGQVYVNGHLYDDFSGEELNSDKWITGQIKK